MIYKEYIQKKEYNLTVKEKESDWERFIRMFENAI